MVKEQTVQRIARHLKILYNGGPKSAHWPKLEVIEAESKVSRQTISRVVNNNVREMHQRTANRLASFIEKETNGEVSTSYLLSPPKDFTGRNLEGVSLQDEDLSHADFTNANLNDANLSNCNLQDATFALATLVGANLSGVDAARTDFRSADFTESNLSYGSFVRCKMHNIEAQATVLENTFINRTWFTGANFQSAEFVNVTWNTWGSFCRGIVLPQFNPNQIQRGHDCNDIIAGLFLYEFPEDFEMRQICEFIVSRLFHRCWHDLVERMLKHYEHRIPDLENAFAKYPKWRALERWQFAYETYFYEDMDDFLKLRESKYFELFPGVIRQLIRGERERRGLLKVEPIQ